MLDLMASGDRNPPLAELAAVPAALYVGVNGKPWVAHSPEAPGRGGKSTFNVPTQRPSKMTRAFFEWNMPSKSFVASVPAIRNIKLNPPARSSTIGFNLKGRGSRARGRSAWVFIHVVRHVVDSSCGKRLFNLNSCN